MISQLVVFIPRLLAKFTFVFVVKDVNNIETKEEDLSMVVDVMSQLLLPPRFFRTNILKIKERLADFTQDKILIGVCVHIFKLESSSMTLNDVKKNSFDTVVIDTGIGVLKTYHTCILGGLLVPPENKIKG